MRRYIRSRTSQVYFFTAVTDGRRPILTTPQGRVALRTAFHTIRASCPFEIVAIMPLPDHLHTVWHLPRGDSDYSTRWRWLKTEFTRHWLKHCGAEWHETARRSKKHECSIWQRRFWEHTCRDENDLTRCVDHVHVNPLKHGLVSRVADWPWSSFHRYVRPGEYDVNWGNATHWYGDEFRHAE